MKYFSVVLVCVFLFMASCSKSDIAHEGDFKKSRNAWNQFKAKNNNSYLFVLTGGSLPGSIWFMEIRVNNGVPVQRKFSYEIFFGVQKPAGGWTAEKRQEIVDLLAATEPDFAGTNGQYLADILEWVEGPAQIGVHKNTAASTFLTLDEVYDEAEKNWLKERKDVSFFFEAKNGGIISSCGYIPKGCQDDCFTGITISSISSL